MERITLAEREEIAFKLHHLQLSATDPERHELEAETKAETHPSIAGALAFERMLSHTNKIIGSQLEEIIFKVMPRIKEEFRTQESLEENAVVRCIASGIVSDLERTDIFQSMAETISNFVTRQGSGLANRNKLEAFHYELILELAGDCARKAFRKTS